MTDRFFYDPASDAQRQKEYNEAIVVWESHLSQYNYRDALNVASAMREYPSMSPDMAATIGATGLRWDDPALTQIIAHDNREQNFVQQALTELVGPVTRPAIAGFYDLYDAGIARPLRHVTRMAQGESFSEAFVNSGIGIAGETIGALKRGEDVTLGEGILPGAPRDPLMAPGASDVLVEQMEAGRTPQDAISYTEQWSADNHATNVFNRSREINESTMLHNTRNGVNQAYHLTPGRLLAQPLTSVIEPETNPWNLLTGSVDFTLAVGADPLNPIARKLTRIAKARNRAVGITRRVAPGQELNETAEALGGVKIRAEDDGAAFLDAQGVAIHGSPTPLTDDVLDSGGIGRDLAGSDKFAAGETGRINVFNMDELPADVRHVLETSESGAVERYLSEHSMSQLFPNHTPDEISALHAEMGRAVETQQAAQRALEGRRVPGTATQRVGALDANDREVLDVIMRRLQGEEIDDFDDFVIRVGESNIPQSDDPVKALGDWRRGLEAGYEPDELAEINRHVDDWYNSIIDQRDNEIFGSAVLDELTPAQRTQVERMRVHFNHAEAVYGKVDEPVTASGSFTMEEWREMRDIGYVFRTRDDWTDMVTYLDELKAQGGVKVKGRWLEHPMTWERYIDTKKGQRFVQHLADNKQFDSYSLLPGMSEADIAYIGLIDDTEEITRILKHWYGTPASRFKVPKVSRSQGKLNSVRIDANAGARTSTSKIEHNHRISQYGRRLLSQMGDNSFDPYDLGTNHEIIRNYGDLLGASKQQMDEAVLIAMDDVPQHEAYLRDFARRHGEDSERFIVEQRRVEELVTRTPAERMTELSDEIFKWMRTDLLRKGHDAQYVDEIFSEWRAAATKNRQYADNAAALPISVKGAQGRSITNARTGETVTLMPSEALLDSQLSSRSWFMPSMRDTRRVTAKMRKQTEYVRAHLGKSPAGITTSTSQSVVDRLISGWRNLALLRMGWMFRVVPDEMARFYGYGYSDIATNPMSMFFMSLGMKGDDLPNGESLRAMWELMGLGADNGIFRGIDDLPYYETGQRGANWSSTSAVVRNADDTLKIVDGKVLLTDKGAQGIARRILQLNQSKLTQSLLDHNTIDDAVEYLLYTKEGRAVLRDIGRRTDDTTSLGRATIPPPRAPRAGARTSFDDAQDLLNELDEIAVANRIDLAEGTSRQQQRWVAIQVGRDDLSEGAARYLDEVIEEKLGRKPGTGEALTEADYHSIDSTILDDVARHLDEADGPLPDISNTVPGMRTDADQKVALRSLLETIDAQVHQYSGGSWVSQNDAGQWFDDLGDPVETYTVKDYNTGVRYTREELIAMLKERGLTGPRGGAPGRGDTLATLRSKLLENDGLPGDLATRREGYVVIKNGSPEMRNVIHKGKFLEDGNKNTAVERGVRNLFGRVSGDLNRGEYVWVIRSADETVTPKVESAYRDLTVAGGRVRDGEYIAAISKEALPPSVFVEGKGSQLRIDVPYQEVARNGDDAAMVITKQMVDAEAQKLLDDGAISYIHNDMSKGDFQAFEGRLKSAYNQDYPPVQSVSVPDKPYLNAADEKRFIDELFRYFGKEPSMFATRRPFVTLRTWELLADHAVTGSPALRAKIILSAQDTGMGSRFTRFMEDALDARGWDKPQQLANGIDDLDEIVGMAWGQAVDDTKNLFYDLTKGGAWQDATRLAMPFADAWWEVVSRWSHLMNPLNTGGRPLQLARRGSQLHFAAESSGWYDYNSQGERVFSFPGSAALFNMMNPGSDMQFLPQVSASQLAFVDFGDPSSAGAPGFSPFVQVTGAMARPLIPPSMKPAFDKVIYRGFAPTERSISGVAGAFMPTWVRRVFAATFEDEFERKYSSMMARTTNVLAASSPQDVARNPQAANDIVEQARGIAGWMSYAEVFSSFMTPAQPRNVVGLVKWDEEGSASVKSAAAIGADFALLQSIYGQDDAIAHMLNMYGVDPLKFAPSTWSSQKRPFTREAHLFLERNDTYIKNMPYTLTAWIPTDDGQFYADAWQAAFAEGVLERLSPEDVVNYIGHINGQHRISEVRDRRDAVLESAEERYGGTDNDSYRFARDQVKFWYDEEVRNISVQYWAWDPKGEITGLTSRPTYQKVFNELRHISDPTSDAYRDAFEADPALHGFVTYLVGQWDKFGDAALALGKSESWWKTSTSESTGAPQLREAYVHNLNAYLRTLEGESREKAEWMSNTMIAPLLEGYGWEDPIVIAPTLPSSDEIGYADKLGER